MPNDWLKRFIEISQNKSLGFSPIDNSSVLKYVFMDYGNGYGNLIIWDDANKAKKIFDRVGIQEHYPVMPLSDGFLEDYKLV